MKHSIQSTVKNGVLTRNRNQLKQVIESFEGKNIIVTVEPAKKKRSIDQNSYYWGCLLPIVQEGLKEATGELRTHEHIHYNILLKMFSPEREIVNIQTGEVISEYITSSGMTTTEFCTYIMEIQRWGAEFLGINIPDPSEQITIE